MMETSMAESDDAPRAMPHTLAVALSGGGYRAAAWGLGTLWAMVDAGLNGNVSMVSSVSGGSLTNAFVAQRAAFGAFDSQDFEVDARRLAARLAGRPAVFKSALLASVAGA